MSRGIDDGPWIGDRPRTYLGGLPTEWRRSMSVKCFTGVGLSTVVLRFERTGDVAVTVDTMAARPFTGRPSESSRVSRYDSRPVWWERGRRTGGGPEASTGA